MKEALDFICLIKNRDRSQPEATATSRENIGSDWWGNLERFTPDFMDERSQPNLPNREDIFQ